MAGTVSLYREVQDGKKRKYVPVNLGRGRQPVDLSGPFYLRYFNPTKGKRVWEHVGDDPQLAKTARSEKERLLRLKGAAGAVGINVALPGERLTISDAVIDYFRNLENQGKDPKTIKAYRVALNQFRQSCSKLCIDQITKQDLLDFMGWLRKQPRKARKSGDPNRTYFNKVNHTIIFLKAFGITKILKKSEYPRYMPKAVVYYDAAQVSAMYAAVLDDEERFTLDYFLKTGVRDGEAAHAEYADIRDNFLHISDKAQYKWHPKHWQCRRIPIPTELVKAIEKRQKDNPGQRLIFPNANGRPNQHLLRVVQRIAKRAGKDLHADLHTFRRTFATMFSRTLNVQTIQYLLGHKDIKTTMLYLGIADLNSPETRKAVESTFVFTASAMQTAAGA
jgi:integrase/recombinase XerD